TVDVFGVTGGNPSQQLAGARIDGIESGTRGGIDVVAVDEGLRADFERACPVVPGRCLGISGHCVISLLLRGAQKTSKARGRAGAYDLTCLTPDIAEPVRQLAGEVVRLARPKDTCCTTYCELDATSNHHATFFATMNDHLITCAGSRSITLVQDGELPAGA